MNTITKVTITGITAVFLTACGSSGSSGSSAQDQAIEKISNYAQNGGTAPTVQDYIDAGVTGITNIDEINAYVSGLTKEDVDTTAEIQAAASKFGVEITGNIPPIAKANLAPITVTEGEEVKLNATNSTDTDGSIVSYVWSEGGTTLARVPSFSKSDFSVGTHTITLTITDNEGATDTDTVMVTVNEAVPSSASFTGIHTNLPIADLTGWTECHKDTYSIRGATSLLDIQSNCSGNKIMLACRVTDSDTLQLAASAARDEVFFNTGDGNNVVHTANGVDWYYSESYSMGFAPVGEGVQRSSADVQDRADPERLSWHTGGGNLNNGWRCGSDTSLNGSTAFERLIYYAD